MSTSSASGTKKASDWQKRIEGDWHGVPSVFDAEGHHTGHIKVSRASLYEGERVTYTMDTLSDVRGPLRSRFEAKDFAFGVRDDGKDRVYMGPDFMGAGRPWGAVVDAHYYSPAWMADLRTMVHVLPDQKTQVYSSLLFEGPTLIAVFNGLYKVGNDYGQNAETTRFIDGFLERERKVGQNQHILPFKRAGRWVGELTTYASTGDLAGTTKVSIDYRPTTLLRSTFDVHLTGAFERRLRYERARVGHRQLFDGPDVYGNAIGYGRALYTAQHFHGHALSIEGREFLVDDDYSMSVVWKVRRSGDLEFVLYGLLTFEPGEIVLATTY
jgi:hypothetical protein